MAKRFSQNQIICYNKCFSFEEPVTHLEASPQASKTIIYTQQKYLNKELNFVLSKLRYMA